MENRDWNLCPIEGYPGSLQEEISTQYVHGFPFMVRMMSGVGDLLHIWNCLIRSAAADKKEGLQRLMTLQLVTEVQKNPELAAYFPIKAGQMDAGKLNGVKEAMFRSIEGEMSVVKKYFKEGPVQVSLFRALWNEPSYCAVQYEVVLKAYLRAVESGSQFDEGNSPIIGEQEPWIYSKSFVIGDMVTYMAYLAEKLRESSLKAVKYMDEIFKDLDSNVLEYIRWSNSSRSAAASSALQNLGGLRYDVNCFFEVVTSLIQVYSKLEKSVSEVYVPSSATCSVTAIRILHKLRVLQGQLLEKCIVVTKQPPKCFTLTKTDDLIEVQPLIDIVNLEDCEVEFVALDAAQADTLKMDGEPYPKDEPFEALKVQVEKKKRGFRNEEQETSKSSVVPYGSICSCIQVRGRRQRPEEMESGAVVAAKFILLIRTKFNLSSSKVPIWACTAPFTVGTDSKQIAAGTAIVLWQEAFPDLLPSPDEYFSLPIRTSPLNALQQVPLTDVLELCVRYLKETAGLPNNGEVVPPLCRAFLHDKLREVLNAQGFISMVDFCRQKMRNNLSMYPEFSFFEWFYYAVELLKMEGVQEPWKRGFIVGFVDREAAEELVQIMSGKSAVIFISSTLLSSISMHVQGVTIDSLGSWTGVNLKNLWFPKAALYYAGELETETLVAYDATNRLDCGQVPFVASLKSCCKTEDL